MERPADNGQFTGIRRRRGIIGRLFRHRAGTVGVVLVTTIGMSAILASWLAPYPHHAIGGANMANQFQNPSKQHWFGTDNLGRDIFSRVLFGGRVSLTIGLFAVLLSVFFGTGVGLLTGYAGGWVEELGMRAADLFLGLPALVLAMLVTFALGGGVFVTVPAIAIPWWPFYARLVRSEVLRLRDTEFVAAARAIGASDNRIMWYHILPNTIPSIIVQASLHLGQAILVAASLSFIGLGAKPPSPEWGLAVAVGREYIPGAWWISFFPGLAIMLVVVGLNLLGDGLRVALDPGMSSIPRFESRAK